MKTNVYSKIVVVLVVLMLAGCVAKKPISPFTPYDLNTELKDGKYIQKVENFIIVLDASGSMSELYSGQRKLDIALSAVNRINRTIPGIDLNGALRVLGQSYNPFENQSKLIYGVTTYAQDDFDRSLQTVKTAAGGTPLAKSIDAPTGQDVIEDLKASKGRIAAIIVSDANVRDDSPLVAAGNVKKQFGDRICIYTVLVGDNPKGKALMEKIAAVSECGLAVTEESIRSSEDVADFVKKVFLAGVDDQDRDGVLDNRDLCPDTPVGVRVNSSGCPLDTDGDGVYDYLDKCPGTPSWFMVDSVGCPIDSDKDGVYDNVDQCPGTAAGVPVNDAGCPKDSDKDGVYDYIDKCPGTPKGTPVDKSGCPLPLDSDKDGVYDQADKCPNTPAGATVNALGCWELVGLNFDTARADIKPMYFPLLNDVVAIMKKNSALKVEIEGHTDSKGRASYNQKLSERRATAVMEYLLKTGIDASRVKAIGYGLARPIATNDTEEGRRRNRRVEIKPLW
ncbi:OmpA family protein [Thermodesulfobacteriota bacterium]